MSAGTTVIPIHLRLSSQAKEMLLDGAARSGQALDDYASDLLERLVAQTAIDDLLAPARADVAASGLSDEQIIELGRRELEAMRQERKTKAAS
jgi:hypothetical protein